MAKFTDTEYKDTIGNLVQSSKNKMLNPYYIHSDKKGTIVDYYSQDLKKSTFDESSELYYAHINKISSIKFNVIRDFILYGLDRVNVNIEDEAGVEASSIEGEAYILPNTVAPVAGDFFVIKYLEEEILFKVNSTTFDTLYNGANMYKIEYKLEYVNNIEEINKQVIEEFKFSTTNVGTDFKAIIKSIDYDLIEALEDITSTLIQYYKDLFFNKKVQTFVYEYNGYLLYDPNMIEFMIRNNIFSNNDTYTYVTHQITLPKTFAIDYSTTLFYSIEMKKIENKKLYATPIPIRDINSLFESRAETYYKLNYNYNIPNYGVLEIFKPTVIENIENFKYFEDNDSKYIYNLLIAYFNDENEYIKSNIINIIRKLEYIDNIDCFYCIPFSIYIIRYYIKALLQQTYK